MIAVLLASRKPGRSSWTHVRKSKRVCVAGLGDGDLVCLTFDGPAGERAISIQTDTEIELDEGTLRIMAEHMAASGARVFVDLR
jgi:hypothetical protein